MFLCSGRINLLMRPYLVLSADFPTCSPVISQLSALLSLAGGQHFLASCSEVSGRVCWFLRHYKEPFEEMGDSVCHVLTRIDQVGSAGVFDQEILQLTAEFLRAVRPASADVGSISFTITFYNLG